MAALTLPALDALDACPGEGPASEYRRHPPSLTMYHTALARLPACQVAVDKMSMYF